MMTGLPRSALGSVATVAVRPSSTVAVEMVPPFCASGSHRPLRCLRAVERVDARRTPTRPCGRGRQDHERHDEAVAGSSAALSELFRFVDLTGVFANAMLGGVMARTQRLDPVGFAALAI